ncbi:MAG: PEP-CTERM sorting domain-containing protein [Bryobacteraceae bacterium]
MRFLITCMLFTGVAAYADTILPSSFTTVIPTVGGTATVRKTVTISPQTTAPVDLFFLTDTTGSMGGAIGNVRSGFSSVVTTVGGLATDVTYGAGQYKDITDAFTYSLDQDLTSNTALVQSAINGWSAGGGGDTPEGNLFALEEVATTTSWRPGSRRILIWTGDAPGHDPRNGSTEESATDALIAAAVEVISISATSGPGINSTGQAQRISDDTGGQFLGSFSSSALVDEIEEALLTSLITYNVVELTAEGLPAGVGVSFAPLSHSGSFDRSTSRDFIFDTTFTGLAPGTYNFEIAARVDGRIVATESDSITVGEIPDGEIPEPSTFMLISGALITLVALRRRRVG